jgi:hypothetical protein
VDHGEVTPLWRPREATYDAFSLHLGRSRQFPTYLPWPMSPGWSVSDFGSVGDDDTLATVVCVSGTSDLDGPVDVFVVIEQVGTGLGARLAGTPRDDPGPEVGEGPPPVRVRIGSASVPLWTVSTSDSAQPFDRTVLAGERAGMWLWLVMRPASAMLLLRDDWILKDAAEVGPEMLDLTFGGRPPTW